MNTEMNKTMAETMARKIRLYKCFRDDEDFKNNQRYCPSYSEFKGLEQACKILGIEFSYEFSGPENNYDIIAVIVGEYRVEC